MATEVLSTTFQFKRGLSEAWQRVNPILAPGEPGWTLDTHVLKIGDGSTHWNDLKSISEPIVDDSKIQEIVQKYLEEHPITIKTDATLSVAGQPADAAAVRENCLFVTDQIIFSAGDADDNTFS